MKLNNAALKTLAGAYVDNFISGECTPDYVEVVILQLLIDDFLKHQIGTVRADGNSQQLNLSMINVTVNMERDGTIEDWYYGSEQPIRPSAYEAAHIAVLLADLFRLYRGCFNVDLTDGKL